jgi:hypothetical protein
MAYATRTYTPGSSTTTFALTTSGGDPIGYIQESDISVKVNGTTYTNAASGTSTYQISGTSTIEQPNGGNVVLNAGVTGTVVLQRTTAIQDATVVYTAGSTLTSTDLNNADNQIRFGLQEFSDDYASLFTGTGDLTGLGAFLGGSDTWVSNDAKAATTAAIDNRVDVKTTAKVKDDIIATAPVSIADDSPSAGKITISVDAELTELATMSTGTAQALADLTGTEVQILDGATLTTTELNYVDGVTSAIQTQINGKQASATDLTTLSSMQSGAAAELASLTSTELDILDGATVTTNELNILDGVTSTAAELNILDGVTSTTAELNLLDGVTATTAELNYTDGVTSNIQTQLNAKQALDADLTAIAGLSNSDGNVIVGSASGWVVESGSTARTSLGAQTQDAQLDTLSGMQAGTASVLADSTALGATLAEINSVCENRAGETTITDDDAKIPTSGAVVDYVAAQIAPIGGLEVVATDAAFPNTQPASGVVISISDAGGVVINGSGVSTTGRTVGSSTVTINGFPSSLYSETLAAGVGLMVSSTGSSQTYTYHKLLAKEGDVKQLSDDINDFNERYRVSNGAPSGTDHAGDLYYDTGSDKMLVRNAANNAWEEVQSIGNFYISSFSEAFDNSRTSFTVANAPTLAQQLLISINGVVQKPNSGTSQPAEGFALNGNQVIFSNPPATSSAYFVVVIGSEVNIGAPSNNTVNTDQLMSGAVTDAKVNANAAIAYSKLAALTDGNILIGNGSNVATSVNPSGDIDISNAGVFSIASGAIVNADVNASAAIALSKLASHPAVLTGSTNNTICTVTGANAITGEANLTFDGSILHAQDSTGTTPGTAQLVIRKGAGAGAANEAFTRANSYIHLGGTEWGTNSAGLYALSFGYSNGSTGTQTPSYIGFKETSASGYTKGALVFATRDATTDSAPAERLRIDSSGNLWLNGNGSYNTDRQVFNADGTSGLVEATNELNIFQNKSSSGGLYIGYKDIANGGTITDYHFYDGTGTDTKANISCASLAVASGGGIDFSAHGSAAGMTSELLDDYEEGTWTPSYTSTNATFGYATQEGVYTKIGNLVWVQAYIATNSVSSTGHSLVKVSGLPFQVDKRTPGSIRATGFQGTNWDDFPATFSFEHNATHGELQRFDAGGNTDFTTGTMNNNTYVYIAGSYRV